MIIKNNMSEESRNEKNEFIRNLYNASPHEYSQNMVHLFADYFVAKEKMVEEQNERLFREKNSQS
jgi:hypothetical protein